MRTFTSFQSAIIISWLKGGIEQRNKDPEKKKDQEGNKEKDDEKSKQEEKEQGKNKKKDMDQDEKDIEIKLEKISRKRTLI